MGNNYDEDEALYEFSIPDNILDSKRIAGFRKRNWIEGIISVIIVGYIINLVPFVTRVKIIFLVCLCLSVLLLNLIGIKDQSIFEAIFNIRHAMKLKGNYHLRRPGSERRTNNAGRMGESLGGAGNGSSAADKVFELAKGKFEQIKAHIK